MNLILIILVIIIYNHELSASSVAKHDTRDLILNKVENLKILVQKSIKELKTKRIYFLVNALELIESFSSDLEIRGRNLKSNTDEGRDQLMTIENELQVLESNFSNLSKIIPKTDNEVQLRVVLLIEAETLKKLTTDLIEKLRSNGNSNLAQYLENDLNEMSKLENEVKNSKSNELETSLKTNEEYLIQKLKNLSKNKYNEVLRDDFLREAQNLTKTVRNEIEKYRKIGKISITGGLEKSSASFRGLEAHIKNLNLGNDLGKLLLETINSTITEAKSILEGEIKVLSQNI